jgi:hypothetical protein
MSKADLRIDWATHAAAKYAVENWHYSKCLPMGKLVKVGAWENGKFIGVVLFGRGATPNLMKTIQIRSNRMRRISAHCIDKTRCASFEGGGIGYKIFKKRKTRSIRLIVSFADPSQGHHGGIYQAGNWVYSGQISAS